MFFSHKIVGYQVAETLEALATVEALEMALGNLQQPVGSLIHHSDRGVQYSSSGYVSLLKNNNIQISMTENGDPLENAIAERINGIIKDKSTYSPPRCAPLPVRSGGEGWVLCHFFVMLSGVVAKHLSN